MLLGAPKDRGWYGGGCAVLLACYGCTPKCTARPRQSFWERSRIRGLRGGDTNRVNRARPARDEFLKNMRLRVHKDAKALQHPKDRAVTWR